MIQIQANISGYSGRPSTVYAAMDEGVGIVAIVAATEAASRRNDCFLIANDARADRDSLFSDSDLREAISAYYWLRGQMAPDGRSACLQFGDRAVKADPSSAIEKDGVDIHGPMYRISADASNAQIAALAICGYAARHGAVSDALDMCDELLDLLSGSVVTI